MGYNDGYELAYENKILSIADQNKIVNGKNGRHGVRHDEI
jgi:hypothetical protein